MAVENSTSHSRARHIDTDARIVKELSQALKRLCIIVRHLMIYLIHLVFLILVHSNNNKLAIKGSYEI